MEDLIMVFELDEESKRNAENAKKLADMKKALKKVGVTFNVDKGLLELAVFASNYNAVITRNAGRKKSKVKYKDGTIFFSDIVCMMQTMTDKEISEKIHMKIATYYRHKKVLKESHYFNALDKNKLCDLEYLKSVKGDLMF